MLSDEDAKFWAPLPAVIDWVSACISSGARVLEIGPGLTRFPRATHFVDWAPGENVVSCDLNRDDLPFADREFDFVYCRHVLEDLYDPFHVCEEMSRVARAGYVETPSPLAEVCRGIDGGSPPWRGYQHHRYFVWDDAGVLHFMSKYPLIEHVAFGGEASMEAALRAQPMLWNTYFMWQGRIEWEHLQLDVDFRMPDYARRVGDAVEQGIFTIEPLQRLIDKGRA